MEQKDSGVHVATVYRTWLVDVRYMVSQPFPDDWDTYQPWKQEAWLKANAIETGQKFKEYVGIDDGSFPTQEQMESSVSQ